MGRMFSSRVRLVGLLFALAPWAASASTPPAPRPNLLLIVLDTLRYDATSLGDSPGNSTPFLASLQSRGVVFTRAYSTHDFTPPSHFSLLTGLKDGLGGDDDHAQNGVPFQLERLGYPVIAPANPLRGLASDAAYIRSIIETIHGPIVLVGHSYGGAVITNAAVGVPQVKALVYIAGFAPDKGESLVQLVTMNPGSEIGQNVITRKYPLPGGGEEHRLRPLGRGHRRSRLRSRRQGRDTPRSADRIPPCRLPA